MAECIVYPELQLAGAVSVTCWLDFRHSSDVNAAAPGFISHDDSKVQFCLGGVHRSCLAEAKESGTRFVIGDLVVYHTHICCTQPGVQVPTGSSHCGIVCQWPWFLIVLECCCWGHGTDSCDATHLGGRELGVVRGRCYSAEVIVRGVRVRNSRAP